MVTYSRIAFPFRTISLLSLYIILNTILYARDHVARNYVLKKMEISIYSHPELPQNLLTYARSNYMNFPKYKSFKSSVVGWVVTADIFIVFLCACLVFGFMANYPYKTIFLSFLHFIGIVLCTHMVINYASINFLICGVFFGMILPGIIEIYNIILLFVFKKDFYVPRK